MRDSRGRFAQAARSDATAGGQAASKSMISKEIEKTGAGNKPGSVNGNHSSGTIVADRL